MDQATNNPTPSSEDLIVWPDGTNCYRDDLPDFTHMSDDYRVLYFGTPEYYRAFNELES